jgi:hypothetical protein
VKLKVSPAALVFVLLISAAVVPRFTVQPARSVSATIIVPDDYPTIGEAIGHADDGDTIFVRSGTYYVDSVDVSKPVMLVGEKKETTIIDGAGNYVLYPTVDNVTISGFTVRGGGWGIAIGTSNNLISDNIVVGGFMGGSARAVGDINGDGKVDMRDVSYVARRFLCLPSDPLWDPNADIDGDSRIDMKDISTVARHFGEHYP